MESYKNFTSKAEVHKAINTLSGIIDGIVIDEKVNQQELLELFTWSSKNQVLINSNPFKELMILIQDSIDFTDNAPENLLDMKWMCNKYLEDNHYYDLTTSDLQILQGLCHGILSDGKINENEIVGLDNWLEEHAHLSSYYPYDEITSLLTEVLKDGYVDEEEKRKLARYFNEFVSLNDKELKSKLKSEFVEQKLNGICAIDPEIIFKDKLFCFTGASSRYTRNDIESIIKSKGGQFKNTLTKSTNYLIVGDNGNECWTFACYGRKVEKAIQLRKKGSNIIIANEFDFLDAIQ